MLHQLIRTWFEWLNTWGYLGVFILMAMESSIIPVPSELVIPPAAFWAAQGRMTFIGVVLAGTAGSWAGSAFSYWVSKWVGLPFLRKYGKLVLLPPSKLEIAHRFAMDYGAFGIFWARLLPVLRHLISIPAGIFGMPFGRFSLVTALGAGIWCMVLAWFGQEVLGANPELLQSPAMMVHTIKEKLHFFVGGVFALGALYGWLILYKRKAISASSAAPRAFR